MNDAEKAKIWEEGYLAGEGDVLDDVMTPTRNPYEKKTKNVELKEGQGK